MIRHHGCLNLVSDLSSTGEGYSSLANRVVCVTYHSVRYKIVKINSIRTSGQRDTLVAIS